MNMSRKKFIVILAAVFIAGAVFSGITSTFLPGLTGRVSVPADEYRNMKATYENYGKLYEIQTAVEENFYQEIDENDLIDGAAKGLMDALDDPYSVYLTKEEYEAWAASVTGNYSGIGVTFTQDTDGNYVIVAVEKDSPAEKAGLEPGDFMLEVDGKAYDNMDAMATAIRGEKGTSVKITYKRDGEKDSVSIKRDDIVQHSVSHEMIDDDTAYIQISSFLESTGEDFIKALDAVEEDGAENLILDLRNNGGGLVSSCVTIADEFLDEGIIMYVEDKDGNRTEYNSKDGKTDLETVVLVNENSASASEILAGALKDNGFEIVGKNTFGKGVIQGTFEMKDGSALEITMRQYFSPDGNAIHKKGIAPDYEVEGEDEQFDKAKDLL